MYINNLFSKPGWIDKGMNKNAFTPSAIVFKRALIKAISLFTH